MVKNERKSKHIDLYMWTVRLHGQVNRQSRFCFWSNNNVKGNLHSVAPKLQIEMIDYFAPKLVFNLIDYW